MRGMKKLVIGCLFFVLLLGIGGAIAGYFFVYRPAKQYVASFAELSKVAEADARVANRSAFTPPATGELTPQMVQRFMAVQDTVKTRLGTRMDTLQEKYRRFDNEQERPGIADVIGAYRDIAGVITEAKVAQVDALNAQGFSLAEYAWVRREVYRAAGLPGPGIDLSKIAEAIQQGKVPEGPVQETLAGNAPAANRTLVAPHAKRLEEQVALAWFGL